MNQSPFLILSVAAGGALGSLARYLVDVFFGSTEKQAFPFPTLCVNLLGCFGIGFLIVWMENRPLPPRLFLITGFLGAFTTFSTFSLQNLTLFEQKAYLRCFLYIMTSVGLGLLFTFLGTLCAKAGKTTP